MIRASHLSGLGTRLLGLGTTVALLTLAIGPVWAATETTTDMLFQTFQRAEARFKSYRAQSRSLKQELAEAKRVQEEAEQRIKAALAARDQIALEHARADLTDAIASQLLAEERRVVEALTTFEETRRDFARILPRLQMEAAGKAGEGRVREGRAFVEAMAGLGRDLREYVKFLNDLAGVNADSAVRVKLGAAMASLGAVDQSVQLARQAAQGGGNGLYQAATIVGNTVETLSGAIPLLALRQQAILSQRERLAMANALALTRMASLPLFGSSGLDLITMTRVIQDDFTDDLEREQGIGQLLEAEGMGGDVPSREEIGAVLDGFKF